MEYAGSVGWRCARIRERKLEKLDQHFIELAQRHPQLVLAWVVFGMPVAALAGIFLTLLIICLPYALML